MHNFNDCHLSIKVLSPIQGKRHGAIMPLVVIMLPVILMLSCFVINFAYMELTRTELQISTDAATRAAGHKLAFTGAKVQAKAAARESGKRNLVAGNALKLRDEDIEFGTSTRANVTIPYVFKKGGNPVNAVRINGVRTASSLNGAVKMIFPTFGTVDSFAPVQSSISSQLELDVALVLDRSGSMAYGDFEDSVARATVGLGPAIASPGWWFCDPAPKQSRWLALIDAVQVFLDVLAKSPHQEHVSLVTYNSKSKIEVKLTEKYSKIPNAMDKYSRKFCEGATNIYAGINSGVNTLADSSARPWAAKVIIVLTDGKHNTGSNPEKAAARAFKDGIILYTVTFSDDAEKKKMQKVAAKGGGKHFHAARKSDLAQAFQKIANSLPSLLTQ